MGHPAGRGQRGLDHAMATACPLSRAPIPYRKPPLPVFHRGAAFFL